MWGRFWDVDGLTAEQRSIFVRARSQLQTDLGALSTGPDRFGLVHSDLHLGNLMADGDRMTVIDFDDAGFGWFAHDLAISLEPATDDPWFDDCKAAILEGYRSVMPLDSDEEALIDMFVAVRALSLVGWLDARKDLPEYKYFDAQTAGAANIADRFLNR